MSTVASRVSTSTVWSPGVTRGSTWLLAYTTLEPAPSGKILSLGVAGSRPECPLWLYWTLATIQGGSIPQCKDTSQASRGSSDIRVGRLVLDRVPTLSGSCVRRIEDWTRDSRCLCLRLPRVVPCSHACGRAARADLSPRDFLSGSRPGATATTLRDLGSGPARMPLSSTQISRSDSRWGSVRTRVRSIAPQDLLGGPRSRCHRGKCSCGRRGCCCGITPDPQ